MLQEKEQLNLQLAEMSILLRIKQDVGEQGQNQEEGKDLHYNGTPLDTIRTPH